MQLTIIQVATDTQHQYPQETFLRAEFREDPLKVGDLVSMEAANPTEKRWRVVQVEDYVNGDKTIALAIVSRNDIPTPEREEWIADGSETPYVALTEAREAVGAGYSLVGPLEPNTRLFSAPYTVSHSEAFKAISDTAPYPVASIAWCRSNQNE